MPTQIENMSLKITGKVDQNIVVELERLKQTSPEVYKRYQQKILAFAAPGPIPEQQLIKIITAENKQIMQDDLKNELGKEKYAAAKNACKAFSAIATITQSSQLSKAMEFTKLSIDFAKEAKVLQQLMGTGATFTSLANPVLALTTIGFQIFGAFMGSQGQSVEDIILKELREISKQIVDLHKEMLQQFGQVHEHLKLIHETVLDCAEGLKILITEEVHGFRNDAIGRLQKIDNSIENLRKLFEVAHRESLTQDLRNLCTSVDARINEHSTINECAEVQSIAHRLEHDWILSQSASPTLNGSALYIVGNTAASYANDQKVIEKNISFERMQNILGYLALIFAELELDLNANDDFAEVDLKMIVHSETFKIAVTQYLRIRKAFPTYIKDDVSGKKFTDIQAFAYNTLNFITRVQRSEVLFTNLLGNYLTAFERIKTALFARSKIANDIFELNQKAVIKLNDSPTIASAKFTGQIPDKCSPESGVGGHVLNLRSLGLAYQGNLFLNPILAMAQSMGIVQIHCTYTGTQAYPKAPHDWPAQETLNVSRLIDGEPMLSRLSAIPNQTVKIGPGVNKIVKRGDYTAGRHKIHVRINYTFVMGKQTASYVFNLNDQNDISCYSFSKEQGCGSIYPMLPVPALEGLLKRLHFTSMQGSDNYASFVSAVEASINAIVLEQRKQLIVQHLLDNNDANFNAALDELSSAKLRLQAFALLAGLPQEDLDLIESMPGSEQVKSDLKSYLLAKNLDTKFFNVPDDNFFVKLISTILIDKIQQVKNKPEVMQSLIGINISETISLLYFGKALYINYSNHPYLVSKSPQEKARELGVINLETLFADNHAYIALFEAIIKSDKYRVITSTRPVFEINLNKPKTKNLIVPLHLAAYIGNVVIVEELLKCANNGVNASSADGFTPLMYAVMSGQMDVVTLIIKAGGSVFEANRNGHTATQLALEYGHIDIYEYLQKQEIQNGIGLTKLLVL